MSKQVTMWGFTYNINQNEVARKNHVAPCDVCSYNNTKPHGKLLRSKGIFPCVDQNKYETTCLNGHYYTLAEEAKP